MCSSQRSQAFELAATTEQLQVGGGYVVLIETSYKGLAKLITRLTIKQREFVFFLKVSKGRHLIFIGIASHAGL